MMSKTKFILRLMAAIGTCLSSVPCLADAYVEAVPTGWRLQSYVSSGTYLYYTGSSCTSGYLQASAMSEDDRNRLWSTILTGRALGKAVGIFYETASGNCGITSFFLKEG